MTGFLESDDGGIVIGAKSGDSRPVGLKAGNVEADQVNGTTWAIPVGGAGVGTSATVAEGPAARTSVAQFGQPAKHTSWLGRG